MPNTAMSIAATDNTTAAIADSALAFSRLRPRLFSIAYRMLCVRADAEDVVQDAWLRWDGSAQDGLQSPEAWLVTIVTRLSIDRLRAAKAERESYAGWWLPEPLVEVDERTPETQAEMAGELGVAFLWVLERLSPDERAAFLLRQVFDYDYSEVADLLGKSEAACRQLVHRAQERVLQDRKRFGVDQEAHRSLLGKFIDAARTGQAAAIQALLAANVELVSDGGGKVPSFPRIIHGTGAVARLFCRTLDKFPGQVAYRMAMLNGEPGMLRYIGGKLESALAFLVVDGSIAGIYVVRNPDKLAGAPQSL
jgi:RNA polymerase sigma-70 factor (ECF subfamily)